MSQLNGIDLRNYYYNKLTSQEQFSYNQVVGAVVSRRSECALNGGSVERNQEIGKAVVLENPEMVRYPGIFQGISTNGSIFLYYGDVDENRFNRKLDQLVNSIDEKLTATASDYEVCKAIFDALGENLEYAYDVLEKYGQMERDNAPMAEKMQFMNSKSAAFTAYGAIVENKAICSGIAKAFRILCGKFNIPCACVEAESKGARHIPHMLNAVEIDGKTLFVDLTNGLKDKNLKALRYDYFLATRQIIEKEFAISSRFDIPCDEEGENYFVHNKKKFKTIYDMRRYLAAYTCSSTNKVIRLQYEGEMCDDKLRDAFSEIVNNHCEDGKAMEFCVVRNGFCTGIIKDLD